MEASTALNVASLLIAVAALVVSARLATRQVATAERATNVPVVLDLFRQARSPQFIEAQRFAREDLAAAYPADAGITGLPEPLRQEVLVLTWFYDDLGKLVAHGVVSEDLVLGAFGDGVTRTWKALEPYIESERDLRSSTFQAYFEDLAVRSAANPPRAVHARLGLRHWVR